MSGEINIYRTWLMKNELMTRRELFKKAVGLLPIIAIACSPRITAETRRTLSCSGTCTNACVNTCRGMCAEGCTKVCSAGCSTSCKHTCPGTCYNACGGSCKGRSSNVTSRSFYKKQDICKFEHQIINSDLL